MTAVAVFLPQRLRIAAAPGLRGHLAPRVTVSEGPPETERATSTTPAATAPLPRRPRGRNACRARPNRPQLLPTSTVFHPFIVALVSEFI